MYINISKILLCVEVAWTQGFAIIIASCSHRKISLLFFIIHFRYLLYFICYYFNLLFILFYILFTLFHIRMFIIQTMANSIIYIIPYLFLNKTIQKRLFLDYLED